MKEKHIDTIKERFEEFEQWITESPGKFFEQINLEKLETLNALYKFAPVNRNAIINYTTAAAVSETLEYYYELLSPDSPADTEVEYDENESTDNRTRALLLASSFNFEIGPIRRKQHNTNVFYTLSTSPRNFNFKIQISEALEIVISFLSNTVNVTETRVEKDDHWSGELYLILNDYDDTIQKAENFQCFLESLQTLTNGIQSTYTEYFDKKELRSTARPNENTVIFREYYTLNKDFI